MLFSISLNCRPLGSWMFGSSRKINDDVMRWRHIGQVFILSKQSKHRQAWPHGMSALDMGNAWHTMHKLCSSSQDEDSSDAPLPVSSRNNFWKRRDVLLVKKNIKRLGKNESLLIVSNNMTWGNLAIKFPLSRGKKRPRTFTNLPEAKGRFNR